MRLPRPIRCILLLAASGLAACHDTTGPQGGVSLRFSGAASVTDTVDAMIPQALIVEVRDSSGALAAAGTVVRFTAVQAPVQPGQFFRGTEVLVEPLTSTFYSTFATGTTDANGKTGVLVRMGTTAGPGRLAVSVPTLGLEDTVRFTVKPGNAVAVQVTPADTMLYVGKSYTLRGGATDRYGNARTDPVTWGTTGSGITISSAGVVTASAVGRYQITAAGIVAGTPGSSTGWVSVVPQGRFVGTTYNNFYNGYNIIAVDADGSNKATLTSATDGGIGVHPAWIPGTGSVIYTTVVGSYQVLYTVASDGTTKPFFATTPATVTHQAEPTPTADGKWIFFSAYDTDCPVSDYCIARAKVDGSGYQLLRTTATRQPAPSPDGTKVAYFVVAEQAIRVLDIATNTASTWSVAGTTPSWSPDGTRIAYRNSSGGVSIVNPDGSNVRALPNPGIVGTYTWTPDSKWVIVMQYGAPTLMDAATGTLLPLGYSAYSYSTTLWNMK